MPITIPFRHSRKDKSVLVPGIGIEVHVPCTPIVEKARNDVGGTLTQHLLQSLPYLVFGEDRLVLVAYCAGVFPVPLNRTYGVIVNGVNGIRSDEGTCTIHQAVATLPHEICDVVGYAHLPVKQ